MKKKIWKLTAALSCVLALSCGAMTMTSEAGWHQNRRGWTYEENGNYIRSGWAQINGAWYLFDNAGYIMTGWNYVNGSWYYMNDSGAMVTGWNFIDGSWYYMYGSGAMTTGWQDINGTWYYMNGSGVMQTGWLNLGGNWYFLNGSGAMLKGDQYIDGVYYYFDASGAMAVQQETYPSYEEPYYDDNYYEANDYGFGEEYGSALYMAQNLLRGDQYMSQGGLRDNLLSTYSWDAAEYAMSNVYEDWTSRAVRCAYDIYGNVDWDPYGCRDFLFNLGFDYDTVEQAFYDIYGYYA